jgi:hypothetical protein
MLRFNVPRGLCPALAAAIDRYLVAERPLLLREADGTLTEDQAAGLARIREVLQRAEQEATPVLDAIRRQAIQTGILAQRAQVQLQTEDLANAEALLRTLQARLDATTNWTRSAIASDVEAAQAAVQHRQAILASAEQHLGGVIDRFVQTMRARFGPDLDGYRRAITAAALALEHLNRPPVQRAA